MDAGGGQCFPNSSWGLESKAFHLIYKIGKKFWLVFPWVVFKIIYFNPWPIFTHTRHTFLFLCRCRTILRSLLGFFIRPHSYFFSKLGRKNASPKIPPCHITRLFSRYNLILHRTPEIDHFYIFFYLLYRCFYARLNLSFFFQIIPVQLGCSLRMCGRILCVENWDMV